MLVLAAPSIHDWTASYERLLKGVVRLLDDLSPTRVSVSVSSTGDVAD